MNSPLDCQLRTPHVAFAKAAGRPNRYCRNCGGDDLWHGERAGNILMCRPERLIGSLRAWAATIVVVIATSPFNSAVAQQPGPESEKRVLSLQLAERAFSAARLDQFDENFIRSLLAMLSDENKNSISSRLGEIRPIIRAETGKIFLEAKTAVIDLYEQKFELQELKIISEFTKSQVGEKLEKLSPEFSDKFTQIMLSRFKSEQDNLIKRIVETAQRHR